jgi:hypothetical protein
VPRDARFCPECGTPAGGGTTVKTELPRGEPVPGPVSISHVEPHWFGVPPPDLPARRRRGRPRLARLSVEDTMMVTPNQQPEPYPPRDEGTPPAPAPAPDEDQ